MRHNQILKASVLVLGVYCQTSSATDLVDVIPSLYGGDGVQLVAASSGFNHAPHFQDDALVMLGKLTAAASDIQFPYQNASGGINFSYDPVLDDFVKSLNANSLLFTNPARTLGKGRFTGGISFSHMAYDEMDGKKIDSLLLTLDHEDIAGPGSDVCIGGAFPNCYLFEDDKVLLDIDIELESDVLFLFGAFGLTENIDFELIIPVIKNKMSIHAHASVIESETKKYFAGTLHQFDEHGNNGDADHRHGKENRIGFGDIKLNSKWNFYSSNDMYLSTLVEFILPTGDKNNFMGSDTWSIKPKLLLSTDSGINGLPVNAHLNVGYELTTGDGNNELSYAAALEYHHDFNGTVVSSAFEVLGKHVLETRTGFGDDQVDAAIGSKVFFMEDHSVYFNYRFPLNNDGLRATSIFSVGYATTF